MNLAEVAVEKVMSGERSFCKLLSPNDSGETQGHQSGYLISKKAASMLFSESELQESIAEKNIRIKWQDDFVKDAKLKWYSSKNELRLTSFTKNFPFKGELYTGALFVLIKNDETDYAGFILNSEEEIDTFLNTFGLTPAETNAPIEFNNSIVEIKEKQAIDAFINDLVVDFPTSKDMANAARMILYAVLSNRTNAVANPDKMLVDWTKEEYRLFRALEQARYGTIISKGFETVDKFVELANQVLNRRKSRAGKSLEHHLEAIFDENCLKYTAQAITEGNKRPDFIFPSDAAYHNFEFPNNKLVMLAAKTTCKDRWRQILNEADRLRDSNKYLCTLQQGISVKQMDEMQEERVILVVPKIYIPTYPRERQDRIWTLGKFVEYIKEIEK